MIVVIVVDGQEVAMDIRVAQEHIHPWDLVHRLQKAVEVLEAACTGALHGKAAKFGVKLQRRRRRRKGVRLGRASSGQQDRCRQGTAQSCPGAGRARHCWLQSRGSTKAAAPIGRSPSQKQNKRSRTVFLPEHRSDGAERCPHGRGRNLWLYRQPRRAPCCREALPCDTGAAVAPGEQWR